MAEQRIFRGRHASRFVVLPNAILENKALSIEAKGLLGFLLSRPPDWQIRLSHLGGELGVGKDRLHRILRELIEAGYVTRWQDREAGAFAAVCYEVRDEPTERVAFAPQREKPEPGKPEPVNPPLLSNESIPNTKADAADASAREPAISNGAFELAEQLLIVAGHSPSFWPPGWMGAPMRVETWLRTGWPREIILGAAKAVVARGGAPPSTVQYFEKAIAEEIARQKRPLPIVEVRAAETLRTTNYGRPNRSGGSVIEAADRLIETLESFNADAGCEVERVCGQAGAGAIRKLPQG